MKFHALIGSTKNTIRRSISRALNRYSTMISGSQKKSLILGYTNYVCFIYIGYIKSVYHTPLAIITQACDRYVTSSDFTPAVHLKTTSLQYCPIHRSVHIKPISLRRSICRNQSPISPFITGECTYRRIWTSQHFRRVNSCRQFSFDKSSESCSLAR